MTTGNFEPGVTTPGYIGSFPPRDTRREPAGLVILAVITAVVTAVLLAFNYNHIRVAFSRQEIELLLWTGIIVAINLSLHFDDNSHQFTLDLPILLAVGALYEPPVAAAVALVAEFDSREFERRISFPRAVFNRAQSAISIFAASVVFHQVASVEDAWPIALVGMVASAGIFHTLNSGFVAIGVSLRERLPWHRVAGSLPIGRPLEFFLTYLGYGILALPLAKLFRDVGAWSVAFFMVPLFAAHLALVRAERLKALAKRLQNRERLLERLSDRIVEERKDERTLIASDLHDQVLQNVTRIWMQSRFLEQSASSQSQFVHDARQLVADSELTLGSLRDVISGLQQSPVGRGGLVRTLEQLVRDLKLDWSVRIMLQTSLEREIPPELQVVAYQVSREAIINSLKHAEASSINIKLVGDPSVLEVIVEDDGKGFDPRAVDASKHFGLGLIEERLRQVRGRLEIRSGLGRGTTLTASLPLDRTG
jgi:signal transduction histidine kinase